VRVRGGANAASKNDLGRAFCSKDWLDLLGSLDPERH